MKVFIVFAVLGDYEPQILDRVYADESDAQERVRAIDQGVADYRSWLEANKTREFRAFRQGEVEAIWAAETGHEHLGDMIPLIRGMDPAYYEEREVL